MGPLKGRFHKTMQFDQINHQCIQIDRWVLETSQHRQMDIGAVLAEDNTFYFIFRQAGEVAFCAKTTVQCSDQLKHKIALKLIK